MEITLTPFRPADARWLTERHGALYAEAEGFDASFPALVAEILAEFIARQQAVPPATGEAGWIARRGDERLGSIFVVREGATTAKLRLVLLEPQARGTGLGQRLLDTALDFARRAGYARMRLWTHESHRAAGKLYARNGFSLIDSQPGRAFGQEVVSQTWERAL